MPQVAVTKLEDGPRNGVFHVFIEGDGSGDEDGFVLIDPATSFDPALKSKPGLTIDSLRYDLSGFSAKLEFEYLTTNYPVWNMSEGPGGCADFSAFGGLKDRSLASGTGKLKITTDGLGANDRGSFTIWLRKG